MAAGAAQVIVGLVFEEDGSEGEDELPPQPHATMKTSATKAEKTASPLAR
jgi:hypothetical protein